MRAALQALRPFLACCMVLVLGVAGGGTLAWIAKRALAADLRALSAAKSERRTMQERVARIAQEERELREHLAIWHRLAGLRILGEEHRAEWLDALARIRTTRGLHDLRYQIEPQRPRNGVVDPPQVAVRASTVKLEFALLHEGDLLRFLDDLRGAGNAYPAVRRCTIDRFAAAPGLRGKCEIDLITLAPGKEKT